MTAKLKDDAQLFVVELATAVPVRGNNQRHAEELALAIAVANGAQSALLRDYAATADSTMGHPIKQWALEFVEDTNARHAANLQAAKDAAKAVEE